jgi:hypothetical protein
MPHPGNIPIEHRLVREALPGWKDFTVVCQKWFSCSKNSDQEWGEDSIAEQVKLK